MAMKLIDETKEVACRTAEADAIRAKTGGTAPIPYDFQNGKGFSDAIAAIPSGKPSVLPEGYTQLEYIQSSGTQYLDTMEYATLDSEFECDNCGKEWSGNSYASPFGTVQSIVYIATRSWDEPRLFAQFGNGSDTDMGTWSSFCRNTVKIDYEKASISYDGILCNSKNFATPATTMNQNNTIKLFTRNPGNTALWWSGKIYDFVWKKSGVEFMHLIPAMRDSDGELGMYDVIGNTFLTNQGTGEFIGGEL